MPARTNNMSLTIENSVAKLQGELSFFTVLTIREKGLAFIRIDSQTSLSFDFSSVEKIDSAGVALLLDWWRSAVKQKKTLQWAHLPERAEALMKLSDLTDVLGIDCGTTKKFR